ncbi:MAG: hypothetical protein KKG04_05615, partial [Candidatus Thermoplasmatota archaeon]|nr:hypothetical protein [Candidatus Thermoplasmatota archaeon]
MISRFFLRRKNNENLFFVDHFQAISGAFTYIIKAKAKDTTGAKSDWGTLTIRMPYAHPVFWQWLQNHFP